MSKIKNKADHLPKEKEGLPFGKRTPLMLTSLNSFALKFKRRPLKTGNGSKVYSQMLNSGQSPASGVEQAAQECATKVDSSSTAWTIKIFLN